MSVRTIVRRLVVPGGITIFWVVMMGSLIRDHVVPARGPAAGATQSLTPEMLTEEWRDYHEYMLIRLAEKSEGISYTAIERRRDQGDYVAVNRTWLDLNLLGAEHAFRLETVAVLNSEFNLQQAVANVSIDDMGLDFKALATPRKLLYYYALDGQGQTGSQPLDQPISLLEAVRPLVGRSLTLEVGNVYKLPVLDSTWSMKQGVAEVRVAKVETIYFRGRAVQAYRIETALGGYTSVTWLDSLGNVLKREFSGIAMEAMPQEDAKRRFPGINAPVAIPEIRAEDFKAPAGPSAPLEGQPGALNVLLKMLGR